MTQKQMFSCRKVLFSLGSRSHLILFDRECYFRESTDTRIRGSKLEPIAPLADRYGRSSTASSTFVQELVVQERTTREESFTLSRKIS